VKKKILSLLIALFGISLLIFCCGGGGGGGTDIETPVDNKPFKVLAKNVLFKSSTVAASTFFHTSDDDIPIDPTVKVSAENVVIDNEGNALTSDNLQEALDDEIAIDITKVLKGSTWEVKNKTQEEAYVGTKGEITFSSTENTFTLNFGRFAAAGLIHESEDVCYNYPVGAISYELLNNKVMYLTWISQYRGYDEQAPSEAVIFIVAQDKNSIVMVGRGGAGSVGRLRISILKRVWK